MDALLEIGIRHPLHLVLAREPGSVSPHGQDVFTLRLAADLTIKQFTAAPLHTETQISLPRGYMLMIQPLWTAESIVLESPSHLYGMDSAIVLKLDLFNRSRRYPVTLPSTSPLARIVVIPMAPIRGRVSLPGNKEKQFKGLRHHHQRRVEPEPAEQGSDPAHPSESPSLGERELTPTPSTDSSDYEDVDYDRLLGFLTAPAQGAISNNEGSPVRKFYCDDIIEH